MVRCQQVVSEYCMISAIRRMLSRVGVGPSRHHLLSLFLLMADELTLKLTPNTTHCYINSYDKIQILGLDLEDLYLAICVPI